MAAERYCPCYVNAWETKPTPNGVNKWVYMCFPVFDDDLMIQMLKLNNWACCLSSRHRDCFPRAIKTALSGGCATGWPSHVERSAKIMIAIAPQFFGSCRVRLFVNVSSLSRPAREAGPGRQVRWCSTSKETAAALHDSESQIGLLCLTFRLAASSETWKSLGKSLRKPQGETLGIKYLFQKTQLYWSESQSSDGIQVYIASTLTCFKRLVYLPPLRANYCHTLHMENHPCLWRRIRRVRRIQVCMARKGLIILSLRYDRFQPQCATKLASELLQQENEAHVQGVVW